MAKIITFYSYKGGTGRSMALANVAWILASNGARVLVIDWDLEAPGLHRFFRPFLADKELSGQQSQGVIDFFKNFLTQAATPPREGAALPKDWYVNAADISAWKTVLVWPDGTPVRLGERGTIHFVPAGRQDAEYGTRVNTFDWDAFYRLGGATFLEEVRKKFSAYDYVLIDSRTGISDTSGICTVALPDAVVVCFTLNYQSILGASNVARSIVRQSAQRRAIQIFPLKMRIDPAEKAFVDAMSDYARDVFSEFPLPPDYWFEVEVKYLPYYAYMERLAVFTKETAISTALRPQFERLCGHVTGVWRTAELDPKKVDGVRAEFDRLPSTSAKRGPRLIPSPVPRRAAAWAWATLACAMVGWLVWGGVKTDPKRARADALVAFADASTDPLQAALLLQETRGLPEPKDGPRVARKLLDGGIPWRSYPPVSRTANIEFAPSTTEILIENGTEALLWNFVTDLKRKFAERGTVAGNFSRDGNKLVVPGLFVYDVSTGQKLFEYHTIEAASAAFSPDGKYLGVSNGVKIDVLDASTGRVVRTVARESSGQVDGSGWLIFPIGPTAVVLQIGPDDRGRLFTAPQPGAKFAAVNPSGTEVAFVDSGHVYFVPQSGKTTIWPTGQTEVAYSRDTATVALGSANRIEVRARSDGHLVREVLGSVYDFDVSAHSTFLAAVIAENSPSVQGRLQIWLLQAITLPPAPASTRSWPQLLDALHAATDACLSVDDRKNLLLESPQQAQLRHDQCVSRSTGGIF
jgi:cellulose biosynthesis protein BcsQ